MLNLNDLTPWIPAYGGVLFLLLIGRVTKQETRLFLAAVAGVILAPVADTLYVVGVFGLVFKLLDMIHV